MSQPPTTNPFESSTTQDAYSPPAGPPPGHSASPPATEPSHQAPSDTADVTAQAVVTPPPPATNTGSPLQTASTPALSNLSTRPASSLSPAQTQSPPPAQTTTQEREVVNDPRIIALRGMFPDYDDLILYAAESFVLWLYLILCSFSQTIRPRFCRWEPGSCYRHLARHERSRLSQ
jgi:hypothetical protein